MWFIKKKNNNRGKPKEKHVRYFHHKFLSLSLFLKYNFVSSSSTYSTLIIRKRTDKSTRTETLYAHHSRFPYLKVVFRYIGFVF